MISNISTDNFKKTFWSFIEAVHTILDIVVRRREYNNRYFFYCKNVVHATTQSFLWTYHSWIFGLFIFGNAILAVGQCKTVSPTSFNEIQNDMRSNIWTFFNTLRVQMRRVPFILTCSNTIAYLHLWTDICAKEKPFITQRYWIDWKVTTACLSSGRGYYRYELQ